MDLGPQIDETLSTGLVIAGLAGNSGSIYRADRSADNNGKRIAPIRQEIGDRIQNANLAGTTRAAPRQDQACN
jgi:hypothetical protein